MKQRKILMFVIACVSLIGLWFLGVDKSVFLEECSDCLYQKDIIQYRIFTIPVHQKEIEHHSFLELTALALEAPCPHRNLQRWHRHRRWGLCFCAYPCINGIQGLDTDLESWYTEDLITKLKSKLAEDPTLGKEFRQRVLYDHDNRYLEDFKAEIMGL